MEPIATPLKVARVPNFRSTSMPLGTMRDGFAGSDTIVSVPAPSPTRPTPLSRTVRGPLEDAAPDLAEAQADLVPLGDELGVAIDGGHEATAVTSNGRLGRHVRVARGMLSCAKGVGEVRQVLLYPGEDGYWVVECPSLPGCVSQGSTKEEAIANIKEAIRGYIAALEEDHLPVPEERFEAYVVTV